MGQDWPRTLAHELGHYIFYLNDNYVGFDSAGMLGTVSTCPGAMADQYSPDKAQGYDEFHVDRGWTPGCTWTLSHEAVGRSDWATIHTMYSWLTTTVPLSGPLLLPLAVTHISVTEPVSPSTALDVPIFYLFQAEGGRYLTDTTRARAFLFHDDRLTDLGRPTRDQVNARGARPGDRLCVFDLSQGRAGCVDISSTRDLYPYCAFCMHKCRHKALEKKRYAASSTDINVIISTTYLSGCKTDPCRLEMTP